MASSFPNMPPMSKIAASEDLPPNKPELGGDAPHHGERPRPDGHHRPPQPDGTSNGNSSEPFLLGGSASEDLPPNEPEHGGDAPHHGERSRPDGHHRPPPPDGTNNGNSSEPFLLGGAASEDLPPNEPEHGGDAPHHGERPRPDGHHRPRPDSHGDPSNDDDNTNGRGDSSDNTDNGGNAADGGDGGEASDGCPQPCHGLFSMLGRYCSGDPCNNGNWYMDVTATADSYFETLQFGDRKYVYAGKSREDVYLDNTVSTGFNDEDLVTCSCELNTTAVAIAASSAMLVCIAVGVMAVCCVKRRHAKALAAKRPMSSAALNRRELEEPLNVDTTHSINIAIVGLAVDSKYRFSSDAAEGSIVVTEGDADCGLVKKQKSVDRNEPSISKKTTEASLSSSVPFFSSPRAVYASQSRSDE